MKNNLSILFRSILDRTPKSCNFRGLSPTPYALIFLFILFHNQAHSSLEELERLISRDFVYLNQPAKSWIIQEAKEDKVLDVAIVGGGMAGMTAALALKREGISNFCLFDENNSGSEGPWITCARMRTLRSPKEIMGPALGLPNLTFRAWYEAKYGLEAWEELGNIPTNCWQDYLCWYRTIANLPINNNCVLIDIRPGKRCLELLFNTPKGVEVVACRKAILATGREGIGGCEIPAFMAGIDKRFYAHTGECIDCRSFAGQRVVVIGAGASAFDAAAVALENGAQKVDMLIRRAAVPAVNKFSKFSFPGILHGFYDLSDETKLALFATAFEAGTPPSQDSVDRVRKLKGLTFYYSVDVKGVDNTSESVVLHTSQGDIEADFIVLGTGYSVDLTNRSELASIQDHIILWKDKVNSPCIEKFKKLGAFPYLGKHFEFLEKVEGSAPYLKDIYCFNYGAFLSHGLISGDITGISIGATRLAQGIVADFFIQDIDLYQQSIDCYSTPLFKQPICPINSVMVE